MAAAPVAVVKNNSSLSPKAAPIIDAAFFLHIPGGTLKDAGKNAVSSAGYCVLYSSLNHNSSFAHLFEVSAFNSEALSPTEGMNRAVQAIFWKPI